MSQRVSVAKTAASFRAELIKGEAVGKGLKLWAMTRPDQVEITDHDPPMPENAYGRDIFTGARRHGSNTPVFQETFENVLTATIVLTSTLVVLEVTSIT